MTTQIQNHTAPIQSSHQQSKSIFSLNARRVSQGSVAGYSAAEASAAEYSFAPRSLLGRAAAVCVAAVAMLSSIYASAHVEAPVSSAGGRLELVEASENTILTDIRQLTFDGAKAGEGYFSADGRQMIFQSDRQSDNPFYQIYLMNLATGESSRLSPGRGKTTCGWIHPTGRKAMFSSTHLDPEAKKKEELEFKNRASQTKSKYSWSYDEHYDIFEVEIPKTGKLRRLTTEKGYDAEGSYSPDGKWIAFASNRAAYDGTMTAEDESFFKQDQSYMMDIYIMRADGSEVKRLTTSKGYDGGPFFSADGKKITWRRFTPDGQIAEIYTMNVDGSDQRPLTKLKAMSWAPYFHPSGDYVVFTTNIHGYENFEVYIVDARGARKPVRVTFADGFDGLPVFSPDGKNLSWTKRAANGDSQIYIANWDDAQARRLLGLATPAPQLRMLADAITESDLKLHVEYLASAEMAGRKTGAPEEKIYTERIAELFRSFGLKPLVGNSFLQSFEFTSGVKLGPSNGLQAVFGERGENGGKARTREFAVGSDWVPTSFSAKGEFAKAGVVFAGYGIVAPATATVPGYDSYKDLDVKGKWVVVLRDFPEDADKALRQNLLLYARTQHKATVARGRGAIGLIVVDPTQHANAKASSKPDSKDAKILRYEGSLSGSSLAIVELSSEAAEQILRPSKRTLASLQTELVKGAQIGGFEIPEVELGAQIDLIEERSTGINVLARLDANPSANPSASPSASPSAKKTILIGAHGDHLGRGEMGSSLARSDEKGNIHFGADDNASGVAAVLELAQFYSRPQNRSKIKQNLAFAVWSGEEIGILGSSHFARSLPPPREESGGPKESSVRAQAQTQAQAHVHTHTHTHTQRQTNSQTQLSPANRAMKSGADANPYSAYVNLDMIGRLRGQLMVQGIGSAPEWKTILERVAARSPIALVGQEDPYLPTDAMALYLAGVPSISLFTGAHGEYHTPRDTPDTLNYSGIKQITSLAANLVGELAARSESLLTYRKVEGTRKQMGEGRSFRIYLGTVPDYSQEGAKGVRISGSAKDSPAEAAGLLAGDIIVELDRSKIENLYDYVYALQSMKAGKPVSIVVVRSGERRELSIIPRLKE